MTKSFVQKLIKKVNIDWNFRSRFNELIEMEFVEEYINYLFK